MISQKFEDPWLETTALRLHVELDHTIIAHKTEDMTTCTGRSAHSKYLVIRQLLPCGYFANWAKLRLIAVNMCWTNFNVHFDIVYFFCM